MNACLILLSSKGIDTQRFKFLDIKIELISNIWFTYFKVGVYSLEKKLISSGFTTKMNTVRI